MEHEELNADMFEKYTWKIENFSLLNTYEKLYSEPFILGGYPWRIALYPQGTDTGLKSHVSIYLDSVQTANMYMGWSRSVKSRFIAFNHVNSNLTITLDSDNVDEFNARDNNWGYPNFMALTEFGDPQKGFLVDDSCTFGVEILVINTTNENPIVSSLTSGDQIQHMQVPKSEHIDLETLPPSVVWVPSLFIESTINTDVELFSTEVNDLTDFKGFGQIEKAFISPLEEACSLYPSLIECQKKRSRKFTTWAFTALGRVLYFLKTRKVKEMNDKACKDLQLLWEELETFKFDLSWLEPHVQSIIAFENYAEKNMQVKKKREHVVALQLKIERLNSELVFTEVNLEAARGLLKAVNGEDFKERNLEAKLGYGNS